MSSIMHNLTKKNKDLIELAKKGGSNDSSLFLLDKIHELQEEIESKVKKVEAIALKGITELPTPPEVQKISINGLETVTLKGDKGEQGERGDEGIKGDKGENGDSGLPGKDGVDGKPGLLGLKGDQGEKGDKGESGSPDMAEDIRNKLELLTGNERLRMEAIRGLEEKFEEVKKIKGGRAMGPSVITPRPMCNITPVGTINGSNAVFTLPKSPKKNAEKVFLNGVRMREGSSNDYTIAGKTITFNTAPLSGDIIICDIDY